MSRVKRKQIKRQKRSRFPFSSSWKLLYRLRYATGIATFFAIISYLVWSEEAPKIESALRQQYHQMTQKMGFQVSHVSFDGLEKTTEQDVLKGIGVQYNQPLFAIDLQAARQLIESLPWVHSAMIFRSLPDRLHIRVSERHPTALWQKDKKIYLIDEHGKVIEHLTKRDYSHLLLVIGEEAAAQANTLVHHLRNFPEIEEKAVSAINHAGRRWDLILKNDVKVKLPENDIEHALAHLQKLDQEHGLTQGDIRVIDIRFKDRSFFYMASKEKNAKFENRLGRMT